MISFKEDLRKFMIKWNNKYPLDRWWRQKHKIAFLSPEHMKCSFLAQLLEYEEDLLFKELQEKREVELKDKYIPNIGDWIKYDSSNISEISENDIEDFLEQAERLENSSKIKNKEDG